MNWIVIGFHFSAPDIDGTYGYTATYRSTKVFQTGQRGNFTYQKTGNAGFIPLLTVDPGSASLYTSDTVTDDMLRSGVSASDVEDGNLTGKVSVVNWTDLDLSKPGKYTVNYSVTDHDGNTVIGSRVYTVVEDQTAVKSKDVVLSVGDVWDASDGFVSAVDYDGKPVDLTKVSVSRAPDVSRPGEYQVTYALKDHGGKVVSATARVTVVPADTVVSKLPDTGIDVVVPGVVSLFLMLLAAGVLVACRRRD